MQWRKRLREDAARHAATLIGAANAPHNAGSRPVFQLNDAAAWGLVREDDAHASANQHQLGGVEIS